MHDPFTLFKILIVVLVVVYQGVQALRKRAKAQPEAPVPSAPRYEPEPVPESRRSEAMERIRTLVLGQATTPAPAVAPPTEAQSGPATVVSMNTSAPIDSLEPSPAQGIPTLRDLVLAQIILTPPPGSNGARGPGRSPLEIRR